MMTDDLRSRIAAAVAGRPTKSVGDAYALADAVIAELRQQLAAWAQMCVGSGDMTPAAQRLLRNILRTDD